MYMQEHYTSEYHMSMLRVINKFYCHQSEEELGQIIYQFWIYHETFWYRTSSFQTSYIWKVDVIKYEKSYLWHNLYAKPFTKVLGLVGFLVKSKMLGIRPSERNWKEYKHNLVRGHVCRVTQRRSRIYSMAQRRCTQIPSW